MQFNPATFLQARFNSFRKWQKPSSAQQSVITPNSEPNSEFKENRLIILIISIAAIALLVPSLSFLQTQEISETELENVLGKPITAMTDEELQSEKLRQELIKAYSEVHQRNSNVLTSYSLLVTTTVAIVGSVITVWTTLRDSERQRLEAIAERQREREQQEQGKLELLNEKLRFSVTNLASVSGPVRISALSNLIALIDSPLHEEVFLVLLANLRFTFPNGANQLLTHGFIRSLKRELAFAKETGNPLDLPLSEVHLEGANFYGLDLSQISLRQKACVKPAQLDISHANLSRANFCSANLHRVCAKEANLANAGFVKANLNQANLSHANLMNAVFHEAYLVAADLEGANLRGAQFQNAKLQSAHFQHADLRGARFEDADVNDAFFWNAKFDNQSLVSLTKSLNWSSNETRKHFDVDIISRLDEITVSSTQKL